MTKICVRLQKFWQCRDSSCHAFLRILAVSMLHLIDPSSIEHKCSKQLETTFNEVGKKSLHIILKADLQCQLKGATVFNVSCPAGLLINADGLNCPPAVSC